MKRHFLAIALLLLAPLSFAREYQCNSTTQYCVTAEYAEFLAQDHQATVVVHYEKNGKTVTDKYDVQLHALTNVFTIDVSEKPTNLTVTITSVNNTSLPNCTTRPVNVERQAVEKISIETEMFSGNHWCKFYTPNLF